MAHSILSPSASHRWLNCPAAPRLEATVPDRSTDYAKEGTLAHAICAIKLKQYLGLNTTEEQKEIWRLKGYRTKDGKSIYSGEMEEHTDDYVGYVLGKYEEARQTCKDALLMVETTLDFGDYVPDSRGTADALIIADGTMHVIDFKYGQGVKVDAEDNSQMMIYALGAYLAESYEYDIREVSATIFQPRKGNVSTYDISVTELMEWAERELKPKARLAYSGEGPQNAGPWCQFCRVAAQCRALADHSLSVLEEFGNPEQLKLMEPDEIAKALDKVPTVETWIKAVKEYSLNAALNGTAFPGYKIVEGRSVRKITDPQEAAAILSREGYDSEAFLKPTELQPLTVLEKLVGKKKLAGLLEGCIIKPEGKPTLVPMSDKRAAFTPTSDSLDILNDIE